MQYDLQIYNENTVCLSKMKKTNCVVPESIPGSCEDRLPMPPNGVLGLGLESGGKALAGDWGLLKAELSEVGKPCML